MQNAVDWLTVNQKGKTANNGKPQTTTGRGGEGGVIYCFATKREEQQVTINQLEHIQFQASQFFLFTTAPRSYTVPGTCCLALPYLQYLMFVDIAYTFWVSQENQVN